MYKIDTEKRRRKNTRILVNGKKMCARQLDNWIRKAKWGPTERRTKYDDDAWTGENAKHRNTILNTRTLEHINMQLKLWMKERKEWTQSKEEKRSAEGKNGFQSSDNGLQGEIRQNKNATNPFRVCFVSIRRTHSALKATHFFEHAGDSLPPGWEGNFSWEFPVKNSSFGISVFSTPWS